MGVLGRLRISIEMLGLRVSKVLPVVDMFERSVRWGGLEALVSNRESLITVFACSGHSSTGGKVSVNIY